MTRLKLAAGSVIAVASITVLVIALVQQRRRTHALEDEHALYCLRRAEELIPSTRSGDVKDLAVQMNHHLLNPWTLEFCTGTPIPYRTDVRDAAVACFLKAKLPTDGDRCFLELAHELALAYKTGRAR